MDVTNLHAPRPLTSVVQWQRAGPGKGQGGFDARRACVFVFETAVSKFFDARARGVVVEHQALVREAWVRIPPCSFKEENKLIGEKA